MAEKLKEIFEDSEESQDVETQEQTSEEQTSEEEVESQEEEASEEEESAESSEEESEEESEESSEEESEESEESEEESEEEEEESEVVNQVKEIFPEFSDDIQNEKEAVDTLIKYTKENRKDVEKLVNVLDKHPEIGEVMRLTSEGYDFLPALIKTHGSESLKDAIESMENGDEGSEDLKKAQDEFNESVKEQQKLKKELEKNEKKSAENIRSFAKEKGLTKEHMNAFLNQVDADLNKLYHNQITPEFLEKMYKAYRYEDDVKKAEKTGETKGRNQKITAKKKKKKETDGLPHPSGSQSKKTEENRAPTPAEKLVGSIDEYQKRRGE